MSRAVVYFVAVISATLTSCAPVRTPATRASRDHAPGTIRGQVLEAAGNGPVRRAHVRAASPALAEARSVYTGANGELGNRRSAVRSLHDQRGQERVHRRGVQVKRNRSISAPSSP